MEGFDLDLCEELAHYSEIVYSSDAALYLFSIKNDLQHFKIFDNLGSQAMAFVKNDSVYIIFRGMQGFTDIEIKDIRKQFYISKTRLDNDAIVHDGYATYYSYIKDQIHDYINEHKDKKLILTGHSMGGSLAIICSFYYPTSFVYVFGTPRTVYNETRELFNNHVYNIHLETDIISEFPSSLTGLKHYGQRIYIMKYGDFKENLHIWTKFYNTFKSFLFIGKSLVLNLMGKHSYNDNIISSHLMITYISEIRKLRTRILA